MTDKKIRSLQPIPQVFNDVSDLWWDEKTKVSMMADIHLDHAVRKVANYEYDSPEELHDRWYSLLRLEQGRRDREKITTFNGKTITVVKAREGEESR